MKEYYEKRRSKKNMRDISATSPYVIDDERLKDIDRFVEENRDAIVRDIARLVSIPSIEGEPEPGAPFGKAPRQALQCGMDIANELGLATVNCEDKIAYAWLGDADNDRCIATITHLDVVPVGDDWPADPFVMREEDGYLLGRGVMDDKGPSVLCLYALKYLKDTKLPLRYPVRALLGSNEETNMHDLDHYLDTHMPPLFCFSPDADFPLINGEKGIYHALLVSQHLTGNILDLTGGLAANAIPAKASALVRAASLESCDGVTAVQKEPGLWQLSAAGISGHASMPEGTVNAIGLLVDYILKNNIPSEKELPYFRFLAKLHAASDGSGLGIDSCDGRFAPLTAVGGKITTENGIFTQTIDVRYGTDTSGEKLTARLREEAAGCAEVVVTNDSAPFYMPLDNPAIAACLESYRQVTGEHDAQAMTIGGGTYSRHFPNAAAFGPEHPERSYPAFCGPIHGVNEAARLSDFLEALKIYIQAHIRLQALEF